MFVSVKSGRVVCFPFSYGLLRGLANGGVLFFGVLTVLGFSVVSVFVFSFLGMRWVPFLNENGVNSFWGVLFHIFCFLACAGVGFWVVEKMSNVGMVSREGTFAEDEVKFSAGLLGVGFEKVKGNVGEVNSLIVREVETGVLFEVGSVELFDVEGEGWVNVCLNVL